MKHAQRTLRGAAVLTVLILASFAAAADEGEVRQQIDDYLREFNEVKPPRYLADAYLNSSVTIISGTGVLDLNTGEDVAGWLAQIQKRLAEQGWIRSEILEARVCMPAENVAVFSMRLARVLRDGSAIQGATYTLIKSDRWKIATILLTDPDRLIQCEGPR